MKGQGAPEPHAALASVDHDRFSRKAIEISRGNPAAPFGAVLVETRTGQIVAEGLNRSHEDPTAHGEIEVIRRAAATHPATPWADVTLYTTAEPCCMCQGAILWAGVEEVVFGTSIRRLQELGWHQIDLDAREVARRAPFAECRITGGVLREVCDRLFERAER